MEDSVFRFYGMAQYAISELRESLQSLPGHQPEASTTLKEMDSDLDEGLRDILQKSADLRKHRREAHR